jgi:hypothetical protein
LRRWVRMVLFLPGCGRFTGVFTVVGRPLLLLG